MANVSPSRNVVAVAKESFIERAGDTCAILWGNSGWQYLGGSCSRYGGTVPDPDERWAVNLSLSRDGHTRSCGNQKRPTGEGSEEDWCSLIWKGVRKMKRVKSCVFLGTVKNCLVGGYFDAV